MPKQDPRDLAQRKLDRDCDRTARKIERLVANLIWFDLRVVGQGIIDALGGRSDVFWALDERPDRYDGNKPFGYYPYLRNLRLDPTWGPKLFASFTD